MIPGRVLVTGAGGFVGRALVTRLSGAGVPVRAISRRPPERSLAGVTFVPGPDLREPVDWRPFLAGVSCVVHLAGLAHARMVADEGLYQRINTEATRELAGAAAGRVERFVLMSSVRAQSGPSAPVTLSERDFPRPIDAYGRSKLAAESALARLEPNATILRPVLVAGPGAAGNLASLLRLAALPVPLPVGRLSARRSLVSIDDLCDAVMLALDEERMAGMTALVADPASLTVPDMIAAIRAGMGRPASIFDVPVGAIETALLGMRMMTLRERLFGNLLASPALIMSLGWRPREGAAAALKRMGAATRA